MTRLLLLCAALLLSCQQHGGHATDTGTEQATETEPDYDTALCNFDNGCRRVTTFSSGPPIGNCDPACSYAMQDFLACEAEADCERVCVAENEVVMEVCPRWNFYRDAL